MEQWSLSATPLNPKRGPRDDIVWIEPTFHHQSAGHVPVQWQDVTFRLNTPVELGEGSEGGSHAGPPTGVIAQPPLIAGLWSHRTFAYSPARFVIQARSSAN